MTRLFTTGAEEADPNALWDFVDTQTGNTDVYVGQLQPFGPIGNLSFAPRTGRGMYLLTSNQYLRKDYGIVTTHTELFWGFAMRVPFLATGEFLTAYTEDPGVYSNRLALRLKADGTVEVTRSGVLIASSAVGVITVDAWYYFEVWFKPLNANGRAVVYVDGVKVIDFTGDTTAEEEFINAWQISGVEESNARVATAFDDIVCNDQNGAVNNTYPGMVRLLPIRPEAAGTDADWARAGVDLGYDEAQARNGTFEYTKLQTADADDLVNFTPELPDLPVGASIKNIVLSVRAKVEAGAGVIAPMVISNATPDISADQTLVSAWRYYQYAWALNPDDAGAWDEADLAALEIGVSS